MSPKARIWKLSWRQFGKTQKIKLYAMKNGCTAFEAWQMVQSMVDSKCFHQIQFEQLEEYAG